MISDLENYDDRLLKIMLKRIDKKIGKIDLKDDFDDELITEMDSILIPFDFGGLIMLDYTFILSLYDLNYENILSGDDYHLNRPRVKTYKYDIDVFSTASVRRTYTHEISSYDDDLVVKLVELTDENGNLEYWEGEETNIDYFDSELTDIRIDKNSFTEI